MQDRQSSEEALAKAQMIEKETTVLTPNADAIVPEKVENVEEKEIFDAFRKQLAENKPKKGKGKKGGKKKKKKA